MFVKQRHADKPSGSRHPGRGARLNIVVTTVLAAVTGWTGGAAMPVMGQAAPELTTSVQDLRHAFALSVPATWQTKVKSGDPAVFAAGPTVGDEPPDTVQVVVRDTVVGVNDPKSCEQKVKWIMRVWLHQHFTTLNEGPITLGGLPSYAQTYTWTTAKGAQRWSTQACVVQDGKVYVLTGTTAYVPGTPPLHADLLMTIMNSFRFTAHSPP
jgi:hypothetical protein